MTLTVLARIVSTQGDVYCAGVAIGGVLSVWLARPVGGRTIVHGEVTASAG